MKKTTRKKRLQMAKESTLKSMVGERLCSPFLSSSLALWERWQAKPDGESRPAPTALPPPSTCRGAPWCSRASMSPSHPLRGSSPQGRALYSLLRYATRRGLCLPFVSSRLALWESCRAQARLRGQLPSPLTRSPRAATSSFDIFTFVKYVHER